jgi:flagellar secretion chaperone FliS
VFPGKNVSSGRYGNRNLRCRATRTTLIWKPAYRQRNRAALDSVYDARTELAAGNIQGRSKAVSKAVSILRELSFSLNPEAGPTLARNLVELYDYMQRRLLDANLDQSDEALAEVAGLLTTMTEAWEKINPAPVTHSSAKA